ncbi:MAG: hypothetical protein Q7R47_04225, partial [Candidatus Diapherotrites archaeon]|nr:hypothetical protein [Candidatus Diapherotrites archaeon]
SRRKSFRFFHGAFTSSATCGFVLSSSTASNVSESRRGFGVCFFFAGLLLDLKNQTDYVVSGFFTRFSDFGFFTDILFMYTRLFLVMLSFVNVFILGQQYSMQASKAVKGRFFTKKEHIAWFCFFWSSMQKGIVRLKA